ncbi:hypothetical protein DU508_02935 [Pedobacter chinensis]|uniref:Uncharacterized protein n=2 Tax=Pedobacter chinensis TaxID=2282421 RepID=A0A369PZJ8_9SPHI|nr:hypothetical protein DU508_02935 [Pedobacter chinensis]
MALNFQQEFELSYIDLNAKPNGKAGIVGLKLIRDSRKTMHPKIYDHLALINISSVCAATIYTNGKEKVNKEKSNYPSNAELMVTDACMDDYEHFKKNMLPVSRQFLLRPLYTEWNTILTAFNFFLMDGVWEAVMFIASFIAKHQKEGCVSHLQIFDQIATQDFYAMLCASMENLLHHRYPLSKESLKLDL